MIGVLLFNTSAAQTILWDGELWDRVPYSPVRVDPHDGKRENPAIISICHSKRHIRPRIQ